MKKPMPMGNIRFDIAVRKIVEAIIASEDMTPICEESGVTQKEVDEIIKYHRSVKDPQAGIMRTDLIKPMKALAKQLKVEITYLVGM